MRRRLDNGRRGDRTNSAATSRVSAESAKVDDRHESMPGARDHDICTDALSQALPRNALPDRLLPVGFERSGHFQVGRVFDPSRTAQESRPTSSILKEDVVARRAVEHVLARAGEKDGVAVAADAGCVAFAADEDVVAFAALYGELDGARGL